MSFPDRFTMHSVVPAPSYQLGNFDFSHLSLPPSSLSMPSLSSVPSLSLPSFQMQPLNFQRVSLLAPQPQVDSSPPCRVPWPEGFRFAPDFYPPYEGDPDKLPEPKLGKCFEGPPEDRSSGPLSNEGAVIDRVPFPRTDQVLDATRALERMVDEVGKAFHKKEVEVDACNGVGKATEVGHYGLAAAGIAAAALTCPPCRPAIPHAIQTTPVRSRLAGEQARQACHDLFARARALTKGDSQ